MKQKSLLTTCPSRVKRTTGSNGFSLNEALIALAAGTLVIGAGAMALRSTQTLIKSSGEKITQQQNSANGIRLMRSEIERSLHALVNGTPPDAELAYTDLGEYQNAVQVCQTLASQGNPSPDPKTSFVPLFGLKMADVTGQPVLYGLAQGTGSRNFAVKRCGTPLGMDGRYDNTQSPFVDTVINGIGMMPCLSYNEDKECVDTNHPFPNKAPYEITANDILQYLAKGPDDNYRFNVANNLSPVRRYLEPAFRFETDNSRKLIRVISPMDCDDSTEVCVENTQITVAGSNNSKTSQPLMLTAYARADKRLMAPGQNNVSLGSEWFRDVNSKNVRFLVDGSGSMSACMSWSFDEKGSLEKGNTSRWFHTPQGDPLYRGNAYEYSNAICNETRMERLQRELSELIQQLPEDTRISLEVFSTPGSYNDRQWDRSKNGLVTISDGDNRDSAQAFVSSLDEASAKSWGGTNPWDALERSFDDTEADTLYFLSDGLPTSTYRITPGEDASYSNDYKPAAEFFARKNADERQTNPLKVNSTSVMLDSEWMKDLSKKTEGNYIQSQ
ncbi:hypothetical protein [Synechococcus sp. CC9616]|uniref:hypothetical protein n=1 Tax=Synechococcus sp. CC9616 TaxID=110663 RepID=UPI0004B12041|nr:hypothetical protein [Synechococcus sp. CC9616]